MSASTAQSETRKKRLAENQGVSGGVEGHPTGQFVTGVATSGTSGYVEASPSPEPPAERPISKKKLRLAILAHIKAVRALGRTEINTQEIADALGISVQEVNDALEALKKHGVRRR